MIFGSGLVNISRIFHVSYRQTSLKGESEAGEEEAAAQAVEAENAINSLSPRRLKRNLIINS
jgi:hypothetical protein